MSTLHTGNRDGSNESPARGRRRSMRKLMGHRWTIGVAALALVFALGAISWAATGDAATVDPALDQAVGAPAPGFGMLGPDGIAPEGDFAACGRMVRQAPRGGAMTEGR